MAKYPCKGALLKLGTGGVLVTVGQVIEMDVGAQDPETFDADTLNNTTAGMPKLPTGRTAQADSTFSLFYDPELHTALAIFSQNPGDYDQSTSATTITGSFVLTDSGPTSLTFTAASVGFGPTAFRMNDGMKTQGKIVHSGLVTYPESY